ncbi:hypothetical protein [Thermococcus sp.]
MVKLDFGDGINLMIFGLAVLTLVGYWIGSIELINALLTIATILMAGFVAHQAWATYGIIKQSQFQLVQLHKQVELEKQSLDEMKKQRLTPIVVNAIGILRSLKYKLEKNFDLISHGASNPDYPENLLEIEDELEKPELLLVDSLLELELYRDLKVYQEDLENLRKYSKEIRKLVEVIGEEKLMETLKEVQKETGIEINKIEGDALVIGDGSVFLPEREERVYATILGLARNAAEGDKDAEKLYWGFRGRLQNSDEENMKRLGGWYLQELYSVMLGLVQTPNEEDAKQGTPRDKRVKKIEIAIERLMNEYIK